MASTALEEKINKIRLRNEEIKRRYEEVEADKKNAAKLDALVEPAPSEDWPERKEPPEFSAPALKNTNRQKHSVRKHSDQSTPYYSGSGDGKKAHNFGDGQGPPPDPKYNFLADSEREEHGDDAPRDSERNRGRGKPTRGVFKRRGSGRDWHAKEQWNQQGSPGDTTRPDYEAWRAERNRIDEARISRQRTAEGNWRREWDNDKVHLADEVTKRDRVTLGDVVTRQEHSDGEKLYRSPRTAPRNSQHPNARESYHGPAAAEANKVHGSSSEPEKRVVVATDRSIKVMLNPGSTPPKSSVMSVKVSPPNIAGTGRVGPRQRPRVMYSSQSDAEASTHEAPAFTRQKSVDEKTKGRSFDQTQKAVSPKSPHPQRKRDADPKSPYPKRKDNDRGDKVEGAPRSGKKDAQKSPYPQRRGNAPGNYPPKSPRVNRRSTETDKNDLAKSPRTPQERNRVKRNASSVSEGSKGECSDGDALAATDIFEASSADKSDELSSHSGSVDKTSENVPTKQSLPEETPNSVEVNLESKENCSQDGTKNDNEHAEQPSSKPSESPIGEVQFVKNNAENKATEQTPSETSMTESQAETSVNAIEENVEAGESRVVDKKEADAALSEQSALDSTISSAEQVTEAASSDTSELKEIHGEASGSRESKDIEAGTASNQALINCSANSGLNDSGFLESPSNDSIHDSSSNSNIVTSDFAETSVDSIQSENESVVNRPISENLEGTPKVEEAPVENVAEPSTGSSETGPENSPTNDLKEAEKISHDAASDVGNISVTQQASERNDAVKAANTPNEDENNMQKVVIDANKLDPLEKDSAASCTHDKTEENAHVMKDDNIDLELNKLQEKEIAKSDIHEEAEKNPDPSKSEEKDLETRDKAAEAINAQEIQIKSNDESKAVLENSNTVEEMTESAANEKMKDITGEESASVSNSPNDINKESNVEPASAESLSSNAATKVDEKPK